jgi:hypothetical protein
MSDVSVVLCTYNGDRFVREQLATIVDQTEPPLEIIVSDDGSTDQTMSIVEDVAARSSVPIKLYRNVDNLGFSENFLAACDNASGDYIAFSDQDDRWRPDKLEVGRAALRDHRASLCVHAVQHIDQQGRRLGINRQGIRQTRTVESLRADPWGVYYGFTMLFDKSLLTRLPRSERGLDSFSRGRLLSHDRWVYFLASCFGRIVTLADVLADYRQHDSQLYGGSGRTFVQGLADRSADRGARLGYLSEVAAHRVEILTSAPLGAGDPSYERAAERWRQVARHCRLSADVQGARTLSAGLSQLAANLRDGVYRPVPAGGVGARQVLVDLVSTSVGRRGIALLSRVLQPRSAPTSAGSR